MICSDALATYACCCQVLMRASDFAFFLLTSLDKPTCRQSALADQPFELYMALFRKMKERNDMSSAESETAAEAPLLKRPTIISAISNSFLRRSGGKRSGSDGVERMQSFSRSEGGAALMGPVTCVNSPPSPLRGPPSSTSSHGRRSSMAQMLMDVREAGAAAAELLQQARSDLLVRQATAIAKAASAVEAADVRAAEPVGGGRIRSAGLLGGHISSKTLPSRVSGAAAAHGGVRFETTFEEVVSAPAAAWRTLRARFGGGEFRSADADVAGNGVGAAEAAPPPETEPDRSAPPPNPPSPRSRMRPASAAGAPQPRAGSQGGIRASGSFCRSSRDRSKAPSTSQTDRPDLSFMQASFAFLKV